MRRHEKGARKSYARVGGIAASFLAVGVQAVLVASLPGCVDEDDPRTWIKRLSILKHRSDAIEKLLAFYDAAVNRSSELPQDAAPAANLESSPDEILRALVDAYVEGGAAGHRGELLKRLARRRPQYGQAVFVRALHDIEMKGESTEEILALCGWIQAMGRANKSLTDALSAARSRAFESEGEKGPLVQILSNTLEAVSPPPPRPDRLKVGGLDNWPGGLLQRLQLIRHYQTLARPTIEMLRPCEAVIRAAPGYQFRVKHETQRLTRQGKTYAYGCFVVDNCPLQPAYSRAKIGTQRGSWERVSESASIWMQFAPEDVLDSGYKSWWPVWLVRYNCSWDDVPPQISNEDAQINIAADDSVEARMVVNWLNTYGKRAVYVTLDVSPSGHVSMTPDRFPWEKGRIRLAKVITSWDFPAIDAEADAGWSLSLRLYIQ